MGNILKKIFMILGISQRQGMIILYVVAGVTAFIFLMLILLILRRRKYKKVISVNLTDSKEEHPAVEAGDKPSQDDYEPVIKRIKQVKRKYKSILFTSVEAGALPVTIPVNTAIGLARNKNRCLLIDLDLRRDAVAKVFGLGAEQGGLRAKAIQTEIENLWIWPGHYFSRLKQMNVAEITEKALDKFDFILINAPSVISSPDRKQIISAARAVFICTKNASSEVKKLTELMEPFDCTLIGRIQVP